MEECSICLVEKETSEFVKFTCDAEHRSCFSCVLNTLKAKSKLSCHFCKSRSEFINVPNKHLLIKNSEDINSIYYFKKCIPIINKIYNIDLFKNCLVHEKDLLLYLNNEKNLLFAHKLLEDETLEEVVKSINWKLQNSIVTTNVTNNNNTVPLNPQLMASLFDLMRPM